jgi:UDP-glucose 4-epimerase
MTKVLIAGISGGYGRLLARRLAREYEVVGVDSRPWVPKLPSVEFFQADPRRRAFENVLRRERPAVVVHLGFARDFALGAARRWELNVRGTGRLLALGARYGAHRVVVLSTSYVYGAIPDNPSFMEEDHALGASGSYPEIRDLVEVDTLAREAMYRVRGLRLVLLRPVPVLGPNVQSSISGYLRARRVPTILGFDPMMQFMHEEDLCEAIALAIELPEFGVYNVEGSGEVPLHVAIAESGGVRIPMPEFVLRQLAARVMGLPSGAIDYIKYPCTIDGRRFARAAGYRAQFGLKEVFRSVRP